MTYNLFFEFPNNSHLPSRLERFSEQELKFSPRFVLNERVAGEKKNFFFEKLWPNTLFHKNSGGRICVRSREKCWQSTETLKKTSPFVYPSQRKHAKLKGLTIRLKIVFWYSDILTDSHLHLKKKIEFWDFYPKFLQILKFQMWIFGRSAKNFGQKHSLVPYSYQKNFEQNPIITKELNVKSWGPPSKRVLGGLGFYWSLIPVTI